MPHKPRGGFSLCAEVGVMTSSQQPDQECANAAHDHGDENKPAAPLNPHRAYSRKTHCKRGHLLTAENTHQFVQNGYTKRICKDCVRIRYRALRSTPQPQA